MVCMASFQSSNGRTSSYFDDVRLQLLSYVYFMMLSHSMQSKCKNSENIFL